MKIKWILATLSLLVLVLLVAVRPGYSNPIRDFGQGVQEDSRFANSGSDSPRIVCDADDEGGEDM